MRITYQLERQDYFDFNLHHMKHFPKIRRSINIQRVLMPLIFTVLAFFLNKRGTTPKSTLIPVWLFASGAWIFMFPRFLESAMHKRLNKILSQPGNEVLLEERTLEINDKGLYEIVKKDNGKEEYLFASDNIVGVEESGRCLYIYLSMESAYMIPLDSFKDGEEKSRFISEVERFKKTN